MGVAKSNSVWLKSCPNRSERETVFRCALSKHASPPRAANICNEHVYQTKHVGCGVADGNSSALAFLNRVG